MDISQIAQYFSEQLETINSSLDKFNSLTMSIAKIPAPPFGEETRGIYVAEKFQSMGYPVLIDQVGNIIASKSLDKPPRDSVILCAHLDTVFPKETRLDIRMDGDKIFGPGIGDDSRGLANLLFIADFLKNIDAKLPIFFIANVGEEGLGDLRGTKHLFFSEEHKTRFSNVKYFITIDSAGSGTIVWKSIGSKRYRLSFSGPGGHSFQHFGRANPVYALSRFILSLRTIELPEGIRTTFNVGKIDGGISINAIPENASCLIDLRSEDPDVLKYLEKKVHKIVDDVLEKENARGELDASLEIIGDRPAGKCPEGKLVRVAKEATKYFGVTPELKASSTDANVPQNLGIEAIAVSGSAGAGNAHSLEEWIDASELSLVPLKRNLILVASLIL